MIEWVELTNWLESHTTFIYFLTGFALVWIITHRRKK
jgi:hypothetical protein